MAGLAAIRRTDENLKELKSLHNDLTSAVNFQEFSIINIKWHNAVAKAGGNELLAAFLFSMSYGVAIATMTEEYNTATTRSEVIRVHSKIIDAIEAREADLAERRMRQHIQATRARAVAPETTNISLSDD